MSSCVEFEGKAVDNAVQKASEKLNIPVDKIKYNVISYGSSGIFGLVGVKKAKISVIVPNEPARPKQAEKEVSSENSPNKKLDKQADKQPDKKIDKTDFEDKKSSDTLCALAEVFKKGGTEELNSDQLFNESNIKQASDGKPYEALKLVGNPKEVVKELKQRIFKLDA